MKTTLLLLCALLFVAGTSAQGPAPSYITITGTNLQTPTVGIWSNWAFAIAQQTPNYSISITIALDPSSVQTNIVFSTDTLTLDPLTSSASFRILTSAVGLYTLAFTINGDTNDQFGTIGNIFVNSKARTTSVDTLTTNLLVGIPSEPIEISLQYPSDQDLTFLPTVTPSLPSLEFNPASGVFIPAGSLTGSFTYISSTAFSQRVTIAWTIEGDAEGYYQNYSSPAATIVSSLRTISTPAFSQRFFADGISNTMFVYTATPPNGSVVITPSAVDTVFTPASVEIDENGGLASFTFNSSTIQATRTVTFSYDGNATYEFNTPTTATTWSVPMRTFSTNIPSVFTLTRPTTLSITIPGPTSSSVSVAISSANLQFSPSTVTFSGTTTAITVQVLPINIGPDTIQFYVNGTDAAFYSPIGSSSVVVGGAGFIGPSSWYVPSLWVGVKSDPLPIRVSIPPPVGVTVTPSAPDLIFTPSSLTFTRGNLEQTFTITPTATSTTSTSVSTNTINFFVTGNDYAFFSAPASVTVNVAKRTIQTAWSAELGAGSLSLYVGKIYKVWATANYVQPGDSLTVTPVNPYLTFSPSILQFNSGNTQVQFTVTVSGGVVGSSVIDYIVGGPQGGYYSPAASQGFSINVRPWYFFSAVLSSDDREVGAVVTPSLPQPPATVGTALPGGALVSSALSLNHVHSFAVATTVIPDSGVTITPTSTHVSFSPSSVSLGPSDFVNYYNTTYTISSSGISPAPTVIVPNYVVVANFTVTGIAPGTHDVFFQLSGTDGPYYSPPPHTSFKFNKFTGASSHLASSLVAVLFASIALVLVM